jgi:hypothetical protein
VGIGRSGAFMSHSQLSVLTTPSWKEIKVSLGSGSPCGAHCVLCKDFFVVCVYSGSVKGGNYLHVNGAKKITFANTESMLKWFHPLTEPTLIVNAIKV